jgi:hypothetical protein
VVEAVRTSTSTFGIWAIIVVAVIVLAVWLVGVSVADNIQTRESRRWWQRLHGSEPETAMGSAGVSEVPGQRHADQQVAGQSAMGQQAVPGQQAVAGHEAVTEPIPAQPSAPAPETLAVPGRHVRPTQPTLDGAGDFRRDAAEADWRTDAPTRPDLPAQAGTTGRHALPTQRTGDTDRAERSLAGPDAAREDDEATQE